MDYVKWSTIFNPGDFFAWKFSAVSWDIREKVDLAADKNVKQPKSEIGRNGVLSNGIEVRGHLVEIQFSPIHLNESLSYRL
jgi:hypothetical protein